MWRLGAENLGPPSVVFYRYVCSSWTQLLHFRRKYSTLSSSELLHIAKGKEKIMLIFPSHSTAVLQPLDRENAGLFKICWQPLLTVGSTPFKIENEHEQNLDILLVKIGQSCFLGRHCGCSKVTGMLSLYLKVILFYLTRFLHFCPEV
jgi:hypothetical protein